MTIWQSLLNRPRRRATLSIDHAISWHEDRAKEWADVMNRTATSSDGVRLAESHHSFHKLSAEALKQMKDIANG